MGHACAVHIHRSIVPLETHHICPLADGGPNTASNRVQVCSNGHSSIHDLIDKMRKGPVPWAVQAHYGFRVRRLAKRGYAAIMAAKK